MLQCAAQLKCYKPCTGKTKFNKLHKLCVNKNSHRLNTTVADLFSICKVHFYTFNHDLTCYKESISLAFFTFNPPITLY